MYVIKGSFFQKITEQTRELLEITLLIVFSVFEVYKFMIKKFAFQLISQEFFFSICITVEEIYSMIINLFILPTKRNK